MAHAESGLEFVRLVSPAGATAEATTHGGHLCSWKSADGQDLMFMSSRAIFQAPKAIRGGVPVCFPQFGMLGPLSQQHGFARNSLWEVESRAADTVTMAFTYDGKQYEQYPYPFKLTTTITVADDSLKQTLGVTNTGDAPMPFTAALHTYLAVSDAGAVRVGGLAGLSYVDSVDGRKQKQEAAEQVALEGEVDRIYVGAPDTITVADTGAGRAFVIAKAGFPDAILWNPHVAKAAAMADFGDDEWRRMVCLEPAVATSGPVTLAPGASWQGSQAIAVRPLSAL